MLTRAEQQTEAYITQTYSIQGESPWARQPHYRVFRHPGNRKWFAVILRVARGKLGLEGEGALSILNVKCDPRLAPGFRAEPGVFPGYHMHKGSWLSVALDGSARADTLRLLLDQSFFLTAPKAPKTGKRAD